MTTPSLVQQAGGNANSTTATATLSAAPTAGNQLRAITTAQITRTVTMPSGWTQIATQTGGQVQLAVWQKTSDGSETSTTATSTVSGFMSIAVSEWANSAPNVDTPVTGNTASASSPLSYGASGSPSDPNSLPFMAMSWRGHGSGYTPSSGWTWGGITSGSLANSSFVYQTTAPNTAVSGTLTYTNTNEDGFDFLWAAVWIPSPTSSALVGEADVAFSATATGSLIGQLGGSAALAFAASAVIAAAGALIGAGNFSTSVTATPQAAGKLVGSSNVAFSASATPTLTGSANAAFSAGATAKGAGSLAGTSNLAFSATATPQVSGGLAGTAPLSFSATGAITGAAPISGSANTAFSATAAPAGSGKLSGSPSWAISAAATPQASAVLAGSAGMAYGATGSLKGAGVLAGISNAAFSATAVPGASGKLAGSAPTAFSATGTLTIAASLVGSANVGFAVTGTGNNPTRAQQITAATATANKQGGTPFFWRIGDKNGEICSGNWGGTGAPTSSTLMSIASASKWTWGMYVTQVRTLISTDMKFMNMSSGYMEMARNCAQTDSVGSCVLTGTNSVHNPTWDGSFFYNAGHDENFGYNVLGLSAKVNGSLRVAYNNALGVDIQFSTPTFATGNVCSADAYSALLENILNGTYAQMLALLGTNAVPASAAAGATGYSPWPANEIAYYSISHWVEPDGTFSSGGSFGFYPYITADKNYYGVIARQDQLQSTNVAGTVGFISVTAGRNIKNAFLTGIVGADIPMYVFANYSNGASGSPYSSQVEAVGTYTLPLTWSIASGSLDPSLTLDPATGIISSVTSTPPQSASIFTIQATDSSGTPVIATSPQVIVIGTANSLFGVSNLSFSATGNLAATGKLAGSASAGFSATGTLSGAAPASGTASVSFSATGHAVATAPASGSANATFTATGVLQAAGPLSGNASVAFSAVAAPFASGTLAGTASVTFASTGNLVSGANLSGSPNVSFSATGTLQAAGALVGASSVVFSAQAQPGANGALSGSSSAVFAATGTAVASGSLVGHADAAFSATATPASVAPLAGVASVAFIATATPQASASLAGDASTTFDLIGYLGGDGEISGECDIAFPVSAFASSIVEIAGTADCAFDVGGNISPYPPFYPVDEQYYLQLPTLVYYVMCDPNITPTFNNIDSRSKRVLTFDATGQLDPGEVLASFGDPDITADVGIPVEMPTLSGAIINTAAVQLVVNGQPVTIAPGCALQVITQGGDSGCSFLLAINCPTSNSSKVLELKGILPVSDQ